MDSSHYINPYSGHTFFGFFQVLFERLYLFLTGNLTGESLAADEVQLLTLCGISISTGLLGVFLVFRRMTMQANSLSHTILVGIALTYFFLEPGTTHLSMGILLLAALLTGVVTCYLTECLTSNCKLQEDASIGIVFTTFFAVGIVLITLFSRNAHIGIEILMGNADALQWEDVTWAWFLVGINLLLYLLFFKEYVLLSFDANSGRLLGLPVSLLNYLFIAQVSVTIIGSFRAVGIILVLSFITAPILTARLISFKVKNIIFLAILMGGIASVIGVAFARHCLSVYDLPLPTGGVVVVVLTLIFILFAIRSLIKQRKSNQVLCHSAP